MKTSQQERQVYSEPNPSADRWDLIEQWPMPVKEHPSSPVDMHSLLAKAAEELDLEWPEIPSVERIKSRITEIAFWLLLVAGTIATGVIYFWVTTR
jgi:hypothetical protein